jgi:phage replication-related protein YjqB (UPF0714/DUF867 family)
MDRYESNTALYADPSLVETVDYARRWHRHEWFDDGQPVHGPIQRTAIIAPHGGNIERGTSELCLAMAGYHPATLAPVAAEKHDYWMFEALRPADNADLHVTSIHCNDGVAGSLCGGSLNALGLHGFDAAQAGLPEDAQVVLVGGGNDEFKDHLCAELAAAALQVGDEVVGLDGDDARNIANRTLLGMGAQLELSLELRKAMFGTFTRAHRKDTTTDLFWTFATACRNAVARLEATQPVQ